MNGTVTFRPAGPSDASDIALLINIATHGLAGGIWGTEKRAHGTYDPIEVGRQHVLDEDDDFNWRHATMAQSNREVVGLLLGFRESDEPKPTPANLPAFAAPFEELRKMAPGAWYLSMIGVHATWRNRGIGNELMAVADTKRHETDARGLSLIVEDINVSAQRLYERCGFKARARKPVVPFPNGGPEGVVDWLLMVKD